MFTEPLAAKIIKGEKTATRRVMSDNPRSPWSKHRCLYEVGQTFTVNPGRGVKRVAECEVTKVYKQPLGQMTEEDARAEGFDSRYAFWVVWNDINGSFHDKEVWVVEFKLVGPPCEECDGAGEFEHEIGGRGEHATPCTDCFATGIKSTQRARIYGTWLSIEDERQIAAELADHGIDHGVILDDGPVDDLAELPSEMLDAPIVYEGSHVLPSDHDRRGGSVEVAAIPNHIERHDRPELPDGTLKDWLRLSVRSCDSAEWESDRDEPYVKGGEGTVVLTRSQAERLRDTLTGWLDRPTGEGLA